MKIFTDGARCESCQLPRIEKGFVQLGHKIVDDIRKADILYSNNPWYDGIVPHLDNEINMAMIGFEIDCPTNRKIIFNVLDLAPHLGDKFPLARLKEALEYAHIVTCISETVRDDCTARLGITPEVIYNPMMDIHPEMVRDKKYTVLANGRLLDPNKRAHLGIQALHVLGIKSSEFAVCGSEYPGYGENLGMVSEATLRQLYNQVDFVLVTSRHEGLGLQIPEAMAVGAIPVVCNDLSTRQEFLPSDLFPEYDEIYPNTHSVIIFMDRIMTDPEYKKNLKQRLYNHYNTNLHGKFNGLDVANRIIQLYHKLGK